MPNSSVADTLVALDIGARTHAAAWKQRGRRYEATVDNRPEALRAFLAARCSSGAPVRLLVEATGIYFLDVALMAVTLGIEVMVINPKAAHNFARALGQRAKTDRLDAAMLLEFLARMPFRAWTPPSRTLLALRYYGRHLVQLNDECTRAKNRLHALTHTTASPRALQTDLKRSIRGIERRIARLRTEALALIEAEPEARAAYAALTSIVGIGAASAVSLLGELMVLPRSLRTRACVSHAGLDVHVYQSGTSVAQAPRISRQGNTYLRRALFMPALSAIQHDPHAAAFRQRLLDRGKKKMQADVAVMRKLLTVSWAMVKDPQPYDGSRLYLAPTES